MTKGNEDESNSFVLKPGSSLAALSPEERRKLARGQREALKKKDALNKLREQICFFLDWAKKEGKLPAP